MSSDYKLTIAKIPKLSGACPFFPSLLTAEHAGTELPSEQAALAAARKLVESATEWKRGKTFDRGKVQAYSKPKGSGDGAGWHCRVSEHTPQEATFDEFWKYLGEEHAKHETEYVFIALQTYLRLKRLADTSTQ